MYDETLIKLNIHIYIYKKQILKEKRWEFLYDLGTLH